MAAAELQASRVPLVDYLRLGAHPYLRAYECRSCGARYFDRRNACAKCGKTEFRNARVKNRGVVRSFTIVHRAAPGVPVPYVSAIIETEDGTARLKGFSMVNSMISPDSVWVRGTHMTPFGRYPDRDAVDLAAQSAMAAPMVSYPNTLLMCCPTGDGAASAVLVSGERLASMSEPVRRRAVKISASVLTSDPYVESGQVQPDVNTLTRNAAAKAYESAGIDPDDLDLIELHDCFATAELIHYDNLGLCERGGAGDFIDSGAPLRDGSTPVNVSGGLISKGHPIGATGIANIYEVSTQLRGEAGDRQIEGAKVGLTHVIGLGSACGIHILEKAAA